MYESVKVRILLYASKLIASRAIVSLGTATVAQGVLYNVICHTISNEIFFLCATVSAAI